MVNLAALVDAAVLVDVANPTSVELVDVVNPMPLVKTDDVNDDVKQVNDVKEVNEPEIEAVPADGLLLALPPFTTPSSAATQPSTPPAASSEHERREACDVCAGRCAAPPPTRRALSLPIHIPRAVESPWEGNDRNGGFLQLRPESAERVLSDIWARGVDPQRMPPPEVDTLLRLATLGVGREGEVMLAVAPDGALCALKVPHHRPGTPVPASEDAANARRLLRERNAWHALWDRHDVRLQRFAGRTTLVMPYVLMAEPVDWESGSRRAGRVMAAAEAAVAQIARAGYTYFAERKHVGLYDGPEGEIVAIFVDLSTLKVRPPGTTEADALKEMLAILHKSATIYWPPLMPPAW